MSSVKNNESATTRARNWNMKVFTSPLEAQLHFVSDVGNPNYRACITEMVRGDDRKEGDIIMVNNPLGGKDLEMKANISNPCNRIYASLEIQRVITGKGVSGGRATHGSAIHTGCITRLLFITHSNWRERIGSNRLLLRERIYSRIYEKGLQSAVTGSSRRVWDQFFNVAVVMDKVGPRLADLAMHRNLSTFFQTALFVNNTSQSNVTQVNSGNWAFYGHLFAGEPEQSSFLAWIRELGLCLFARFERECSIGIRKEP